MNFPKGIYKIKVEGVYFTGEIVKVLSLPINCGVSLWTIGVQIGSKLVEITAPRTCFRVAAQKTEESGGTASNT